MTHPIDQTLWQRGHTLSDYADQMTRNRGILRRRLRQVQLRPADQELFARLARPVQVLVLTEDWCSDALMNLPILAKVANAAPQMALRIFLRGQSPLLKEYYPARGITSIPVFHFLDASFSEIGLWVERSQAAHQRLEVWRAAHPEIVRLMARPDKTLGEKRQVRTALAARLEAMESWYAQGLQQATVAELKAILAPLVEGAPEGLPTL